MSTTQFGRKASLVVGPAAGDALDLSALRFSFEIRRDDIQTLNRLHVRIFNVSDNTANRLQGEEFTRVVLQAGYAQGAYGVIFDGNITQTRRGRSSPTETVIEIDASSGDDWYTNAVVEQTFAGGSTSMDHVQAAIETMKPYGLSVGYLPAFEAKPLPRGKLVFAMARDVLENAARNLGADWSIQDTQFQMVPQNSYIPGDALELSSSTGMIGMPTREQNGVTVKCLLNPKASVSGLVRIEEKSLSKTVVKPGENGAGSPARTTGADPAKPRSDGLYKIVKVEHEGDTRGTAWYSTLTCVAVDQSISPSATGGGVGPVKPRG
jgi:hypothetical protein